MCPLITSYYGHNTSPKLLQVSEITLAGYGAGMKLQELTKEGIAIDYP